MLAASEKALVLELEQLSILLARNHRAVPSREYVRPEISSSQTALLRVPSGGYFHFWC